MFLDPNDPYRIFTYQELSDSDKSKNLGDCAYIVTYGQGPEYYIPASTEPFAVSKERYKEYADSFLIPRPVVLAEESNPTYWNF